MQSCHFNLRQALHAIFYPKSERSILMFQPIHLHRNDTSNQQVPSLIMPFECNDCLLCAGSWRPCCIQCPVILSAFTWDADGLFSLPLRVRLSRPLREENRPLFRCLQVWDRERLLSVASSREQICKHIQDVYGYQQ